MLLRRKTAVPDHWRRAARLGAAVALLSCIGLSLITREGHAGLIMAIKWACLTCPVVTMPLLGKVRILILILKRAGTDALPLPLSVHPPRCWRPPIHPAIHQNNCLQTAQVGFERSLGTVIGGSLGFLASAAATRCWTLVRLGAGCCGAALGLQLLWAPACLPADTCLHSHPPLPCPALTCHSPDPACSKPPRRTTCSWLPPPRWHPRAACWWASASISTSPPASLQSLSSWWPSTRWRARVSGHQRWLGQCCQEGAALAGRQGGRGLDGARAAGQPLRHHHT